MAENNTDEDNIDWSLTTWEGARRESMRRWAQLPLEQIISALEEMEQLNAALAAVPKPRNTLHDQAGTYTTPDTTPDDKK